MNFTAYIESQKSMIRRRSGTSFFENGTVINIPSRERLLAELNGLKGLNVRERSGRDFYRGA